uniref:Sensor domain-containing protein n=1 Tax=Hyaloperonospora arabidopsidis (strain Emoy2) TaxID=559515 RepID=M4BTC8_HYAAE
MLPSNLKATVSQRARVLIFLSLNCVLAGAGFIVIVFGLALSLGSLMLCCLGVVMLQGLLYLAPLLARLDVELHNFVETKECKLHGQIPYYGDRGIYVARPSLAALLYFSTAKLGVGVLSAMVVVIPLSMPIHAFTSPIFRAEYFDEGWLNLIAFMAVATALLVAGFVIMPYVARLSCITTRLLCGEIYPSIYMHDHRSASGKKLWDLGMPSYGTKQPMERVRRE